MKKILIIISFLLFSIARASDGVGDSAGGSKYSWKRIKSDKRLVIDTFNVKFEKVKLPVTETCYLPSTDEMRSSDKVRFYEDDSINPGEDSYYFFTIKDIKHVFTDRRYEDQYCGGTGNECIWLRRDREYPLHFKVQIRANSAGNNQFGRPLFKKPYRVPECYAI